MIFFSRTLDYYTAMIHLTRPQIEELIDHNLAAKEIALAYQASSRGKVNLPPVGHITFPKLDADCHIKFGHIEDDPYFVIKIATGFPNNETQHALPTGNGVMLVLSATTGEVAAVLHDEMRLTDLRTGIGGAIASKALARVGAQKVLIVGTGPQARAQIDAHAALFDQPLQFSIWGRNLAKAAAIASELSNAFVISIAPNLDAAARESDIIVTTTGATHPIIASDWIQPGTHITAVGADAPGKQELDIDLMRRANMVCVDLVSQCVDHGEVHHAVKAGLISKTSLVEIGELLAHPSLGRTNDTDVTIADLTGIAAQDIAMAKVVLEAYQRVGRG